MSRLSDIELAGAKKMAHKAIALSEAAMQFRAALAATATDSNAASTLGLFVRNSETNVVLNFALTTPHGSVEVVFDQALKGGELVGRFRFFLIETGPTREQRATEIWTILFTENGNATWDPPDAFAWNFMADALATEAYMGMAVLTLLAKLQKNVPAY
ncbi:hypothetical protein [Burkholderia pyrrocinia]|nr:hypothetical protein [Burkholderia pyrrocinia]